MNTATSKAAQRRVGILLALLLSFFAVAIYSPLHVHENGDPKKCSLNDIEHQVADAVAPVLDLPKPTTEQVRIEVPATPAPVDVALRPAASRGPPASSLS